MPHALTPLGRQLRSVLVSLAPSRCPRSPEVAGGSLRTRDHHASSRRGRAASAAAIAEDFDATYDALHNAEESPWQPTAVRSEKRRRQSTRRDYLSEALRNVGTRGLSPYPQPRKLDLSHANPKEGGYRKTFRVNAKRHAAKDGSVPKLSHTVDLRLERITASFIQHTNAAVEIVQGPWTTPFELTKEETAYLVTKSVTLEDIQAWAGIIANRDSFGAASALAKRNAMSEVPAVPIFVLQYLLRRTDISARTLQSLLQQTPEFLDRRLALKTRDWNVSENTVFILFVRLSRHARRVWPAAMGAITSLLLQYQPRTYTGGTASTLKQVASLTYLLNQAMHLLAMPTAIEPYHDQKYKEAAVVHILRFMTEHTPSLQLNRDGYRAVVQIQLAQSKTPGEKQWAELKALSWPPWKQEKTAIDALITVQEHGHSRAGDTLRRMREAGYSPLAWEKAAELYAGWDTDGTPSIQTRAVLSTGGSARYAFGGAVWAARIECTRTAQEAWAAYLAFEDSQDADDQDVYLATFRKLYEEEKRQRNAPVGVDVPPRDASRGERSLPGDKREVEPLPPSTHLYTYIRAPLPTVESFFRHLQDRHVKLGTHCLSFLVANAASLQLGITYLRSDHVKRPAVDALLSLDPMADHASFPIPIFTALVTLLCRYSNVPLSKVDIMSWQVRDQPTQARPVLDKRLLNLQHPLVFALELLRLRRTTFRPAWNVVLRALAQKDGISSMRFLLRKEESTSEDLLYDEAGQSAILVDKLVRRTLKMMQTLHVDLDTTGFYCVCLATENAALACWRILRQDVERSHSQLSESPGQQATTSRVKIEAKDLLRLSRHAARLKGLFAVLMGDVEQALPRAIEPLQTTGHDESIQTTPPTLPRLLAIPGPAVLHAYIRALGWLGDHDGLLVMTNWMVEYKVELAEQRFKHTNGERLMRRAIVALRVFLERYWVPREQSSSVDTRRNDDDDADTDGNSPTLPEALSSDHQPKRLPQLENAASTQLVREVRLLIDGVEEWHGWPADEEVDRYCRDSRFEEVRDLYDDQQ